MEMRKSKMASSFIFWASGLRASTPFGLSFGLGCHHNPIDAATSAVFEGLRHIQWILEQENLEYLNSADFGNKSASLISQHIKLALNPQYFKEVSVLFNKINQDENTIEEDFNFQIEELALTEIGTDCPIVGIRSKSDCAQNLFFGKTAPEVINLKRLKSFLKRDVKWADISKIIHPMG